jgi:type II secretory ATPase GspE/PulE/Tfp pilus assembly ATPase PilB-like protein
MKSEKVTQHPSSPTSDAKRSKLGEILVENGAITVGQLEHALSEQATLKLPLGQILLKLDYVTDETMRQALGHQLNVPYLDLENVMIDRSLARVINPTFAKRHSLLPVATVGRTLTIAMDDPTATAVVQDLQRLTGFSVTVVTSSSRAIQHAFRRLYDDLPDAAEPSRAEADRSAARSQIIGAPYEAEQPVDGLFHQLLAAALERGARDLHLEFSPAGLDVRLRIDGLLQRPALGPLQEALNQQARELAVRIRTLSQIDPAAPHRPQHGRAGVAVGRGGRLVTVDLRISVVPGYGGDSVAIRLLDRSAAPPALDALGLPPEVVSRVGALLARPAGVFLVTGPAASRTADTLHACLRPLAHTPAHVVTAENPIAYVNDALTQSEVGGAPGSPFASHVRALLQHDADVIMIGDLDDRETAALAFRAAQGGCLVLAGFTAGAGAVDVVAALLDLGVAPSAIGQSLAGVLHQRFVRASGAPGAAGGAPSLQAELWTPDEQDARLIADRAPLADLRRSARRTTVA